MGRLDDALRRSHLDVSRDTGATAPTPEPPPWQFGQGDGDDGRGQATPAVGSRGADDAEGQRTPCENGSPLPGRGVDADARERLVSSGSALPLLVEQFRSLAAMLVRAQREQTLKSLIVTSPSPGDGKTHVAVNLALTLADSYKRRVLLVDADLRRPTLHRVFGVPGTRGLSEALSARADGKLEAVQVTERLTLLPAGRPEPDPLGGLSSDRVKRLLEEATTRFDWVIVDSPPVGVLADSRLVAETVHATILVVRAGATRFPDLEAAAEIIGHERILGVVLNAVEPARIRGEDYYRRYRDGREAGDA